MRLWVVFAFTVCGGVGCAGPRLSALETEQTVLRQQVEELRSTIDSLRSEMAEAGLAAPKPGKRRAEADDASEPVAE